MSNPQPQYFLTRIALPEGLAHPRYAKLCEFLDKHNWSHITSEGGIEQGLLHCAVPETDLQREAHALVRPQDRLFIECIWPDFVGDRPLPQPNVLREWLAGYVPRVPLD